MIGFIKTQRLKRLGHVERMAEHNIVRKIKRCKTHAYKTNWKT